MFNLPRNTNILLTVAALSVTAFSAIGIGVMTGFIPSSFANNAAQPVQIALSDTKDLNAKPLVTQPSVKTEVSEPQTKPIKKTVSQKVKTTTKTSEAKQTPEVVVAQTTESVKDATPVCANCGVVDSIKVIEEKGEGTGLGAVAGGVVGALLGNQVGKGSGRKIATVAGAAGGAYAGHQVEKNVRSAQRFEISVRMDDGSLRMITEDKDSGFKPGDKVSIENGVLVRY